MSKIIFDMVDENDFYCPNCNEETYLIDKILEKGDAIHGTLSQCESCGNMSLNVSHDSKRYYQIMTLFPLHVEM
ncbi:hypothetical protein LQF61_10370 [Tetragenococcus koreensis]|uniref:hypothetical protein n=1 Tax=Tetragenococcus koreensis TaxID=290335 RepID=UPI001F1D1301|nr:hypothetical protein [Tetragenococcus koreensis]MCF1620475.1 hypothetical protein [Tetragenococcus koreensis]MCF1657993.1 hypothetical protein [Tetragenococcus koreensis]